MPRHGQDKPLCSLAILTLCLLLYWPAPVLAGIYRWQDNQGTVHYGDNPPKSARSLQDLSELSAAPYYRVATVTDGDTLVLEDGRRVRLLGIDSPEIPHHGQPGEKLGGAARRYLTELTKGKKVRLQFDTRRRDHYHRLLAHLFLPDGRNLNALMLERGLAHTLFKWPDLKHIAEYYDREKQARLQGRGIWSLPPYRVRPLQGLQALRNRFVRLRGTASEIQHKRHYDYLLFDHKLRIALRHSRRSLFEEAGIDLDRLPGHRITFRGWLRQRKGRPYLELEHPYQLERIE